MKEFNITGTCIPRKHYMVDITQKLEQIIDLIEHEKYFTINRARQYGKTTTLASLYSRLKEKYLILRLSFEGMGDETFVTGQAFVKAFIKKIGKFMQRIKANENMVTTWENTSNLTDDTDSLEYLSDKITELCENCDKEILLFIDEVDKSADNQIFLHFLGMLRNKYLSREEGLDSTFKSVILAGVYDIKNLKIKIRPNAEKKYNSPWNIAVDFNIDMSFSPAEIATMLESYEADYHTGMDIQKISEELYFYTNGYPYLVSRLCKWIDEEGNRKWTSDSIIQAEKELQKSDSTLLDDLSKNYENNKALQNMINGILYEGKQFTFVKNDPTINLGIRFGIFTEKENQVTISNIIFETALLNLIISKQEQAKLFSQPEKNQFIKNGKVDMKHVLLKFQELMKAEYRTEDEKFIEQQGRLLFLCFLKPIINGTGFYFVEPETRSNTRMDIVVVYGNEEHIIELKIWHGKQYRKDGIEQLKQYMDSRNTKKGYLLSFSFLKDKQYTSGTIEEIGTTKKIFEVVV